MEIKEAFGKVVNLSHKSLEKALEVLELTKDKLEKNIKNKKFLIPHKNFDLIIDYKPNSKQIVLYLTPKKWSKKLLKSLKEGNEFKSMVVLLGNTKILKSDFDIRIGAFGIPSSELVRAVIQHKS
ncbi:MAG: hypothetical protein QXS48_00305 [Candidatus Aenigmatarchaeota archaeon]